MLSRLALRPDLNECTLEERTLLAAYGMVTPPQFLAINPFNNTFLVGSGSGGGGGGGSSGGSGYGNINLSPNLTVYNAVMLGMNLTSQASVVSSLGGTSLSGMAVFASGLSGVAGVGALQGRGAAAVSLGGGGGGGGGGGPSGNSGPTLGYGSTVSSGYNFALSNANNFGMTTTPVGSVPVHTYGNSDFEVQTPDVRYGSNETTGASPLMGVGSTGQGPASTLVKKLLGNSPGVTNTLINGPVKVSPSP